MSSPRIAHPVLWLSNGRLASFVGASGTGGSLWRGQAVTRWHEDPVGDAWGSYVLLRDEASGESWSTAPQPLGGEAREFAVDFEAARVRIVRRHGALESVLEVALDGERDAELRRVVLVNHGDRPRELSLTSYAELVLGPAGADAAHPAFSKMFVQTEWLEDAGALLATRRPRSPGEPRIWAAHALRLGDGTAGAEAHETDRMYFLGRGHTLHDAHAMRPGVGLSNRTGCVLDPVFSLRHRATLAPGARMTACFWTVLADSREGVLASLRSLCAPDAVDGTLRSGEARAAARRRALGIDEARAARFDALAGPLLHAEAAWRAPADVLAQGQGGAPVLWSAGISGDRPIVLLRLANAAGLECAREWLLAQRYWQAVQLGIDVVLLDGTGGALHDALQSMAKAQAGHLEAKELARAQCFALDDGTLQPALRNGLRTVARIELDAAAPWPEPLRGSMPVTCATAHRAPVPPAPTRTSPIPAVPVREFDNGLGGFVDGGRSYQVELAGERCTPVPWINVLANPRFGCLVSAEGGGYAWSQNSQQNALTPWPNDPVCDMPHEALYLHDEDRDLLWSATAAPIRVPSAHYRATHGKGWSRFEHGAQEIDVELLQCVPVDDTVKLSRLRLRNRSAHPRRLTVTGYVEWMLGANGVASAPFVATERDAATGALFARNAWREEFGGRVAFVDLGERMSACTGDRLEFLGRHGTVQRPAALLEHRALSGRTGAGLDPCGALQVPLELPPGGQVELLFMLGDAESRDAARALVRKHRAAGIDAALAGLQAQWNTLLDTVQVRTPDRAMDILLNDWLPYQVLACRLWARTAYYQASGAYGFRDQLQDVMALCASRPDVARGHLLRAAGRQFPEGDVQHWWLPPSGKGIRTRISDDRLWLPFVAAHYVETTGDAAVLGEALPFLRGDPVPPGATDAFYLPQASGESASVYEHAARAIDSSLATGAHGLPLMGTGDWNDGMNEVGAQGRGESAWLAWFLIATVDAFAPLAEARGDGERAARWRRHADRLRRTMDGEAGWDGDWYRRGYYDDGAPLGSRENEECRIDAIAQSWSVLAGASDRIHAEAAMRAVRKHLLLHEPGVAPLLAPPFDHGGENPGYIKGYPPGIRENGGQYTHGAIWSVFAHAGLGQGDHAGELFDLLNPIRHADSETAIERYRVEPYVACADVYSVEPWTGCGGWTWYTGSAGWLYRAGLEAILGFRLQGDRLQLSPCLPAAWSGFDVRYQRRAPGGMVTRYDIRVDNPHGLQHGIAVASLDDEPLESAGGALHVPLVDDGGLHRVRARLGNSG
ncbi:glycosyl transferase family 36 [Fulvimonas sp. R45]|uniref:GH36-type glycosyl hydrolase domain-containing protein n=1 Tax=Fulvimonas sp. R45 TaxID=3045937 RepID=UPI00265F0C88|nr:glycosyl transferase family 36 [Fulvimonas sp. R45]MDO1528750.1 glycosyl transferase family 36 [Fulvimonas sp. R45]